MARRTLTQDGRVALRVAMQMLDGGHLPAPGCRVRWTAGGTEISYEDTGPRRSRSQRPSAIELAQREEVAVAGRLRADRRKDRREDWRR